MAACPKCGMPINGRHANCSNCNAQIPPEILNRAKEEQQIQSQQNNISASNTIQKFNFCPICGTEITEGHKFCPSCGTKIAEQINAQQPVQTSTVQTVNTVHKPSARKVNVQKGRYTGRKWFIKLAYKKYETDVEFCDKHIMFLQGTGFAQVGYKTPMQINYNSIYGVEVQKKFSIPNVVFAVIVAIMAVVMQVWADLILSLIVFWIGNTATVTINHSGGKYLVPTEFISEAEDLRNRINMAISQSRG